jgi:hypothetical protein
MITAKEALDMAKVLWTDHANRLRNNYTYQSAMKQIEPQIAANAKAGKFEAAMQFNLSKEELALLASDLQTLGYKVSPGDKTNPNLLKVSWYTAGVPQPPQG